MATPPPIQKTRQLVISGAREIFSGQFLAGGSLFTNALKESQHSSIYTLLLLTARLTKNHTTALKLCMNDPHLAQRDHTFRYWCGRTYYDFGYKKRALKLIKMAISLGGAFDHYVATAALMAWQLGRKREAQGLFSSLIKSDPWLLKTWLVPNYLTGIIQTIEELFGTFQFKAQLYHNLAVFAWKGKLPDLADHYLIRAWNAYGVVPPSLYDLKLQIVKSLEIPSQTVALLRKSLARYPNHIPLLFERAHLLYTMGSKDQARALLTRLVKRDPHSVPILTRLGLLNVEAGHLKTGRRYLSYAQARKAISPEYHFAWGLYWQRAGNYHKALTALKRAANLESTSLHYLTAYMALLKVTGKRDALLESQKRLSVLQRLHNRLAKAKGEFRRRYEKLVRVRAQVQQGASPLWPNPCGLQCSALKAYQTMRRGTPAPVGSLLAQLAKRKPLSPTNPGNTLTLKFTLPSGPSLLLYHFFYSLRPSRL